MGDAWIILNFPTTLREDKLPQLAQLRIKSSNSTFLEKTFMFISLKQDGISCIKQAECTFCLGDLHARSFTVSNFITLLSPYNLFSGVELSMRSFFVIYDICRGQSVKEFYSAFDYCSCSKPIIVLHIEQLKRQ